MSALTQTNNNCSSRSRRHVHHLRLSLAKTIAGLEYAPARRQLYLTVHALNRAKDATVSQGELARSGKATLGIACSKTW